jgi:hypothetical protein
MSCPQCGSDSRVMIGPALFKCTHMLYDRVPVPPPIGRPFAMTYQDVGFECGREYLEGSAQPGETACPEHGLFPAGVCGGGAAALPCASGAGGESA